MTTDNDKIRLLIVDDEDAFRELLVRRFDRTEFEVNGCASGEEALAIAQTRPFDVGVLDIRMPGVSGIDLLREIKKSQPDFEAIMLTGQATIDSAIEAMKIGAYDYLAKPCKLFELEIIIRKAYEKKMLSQENRRLRGALRKKLEDRHMAGSSALLKELRAQIERIGKLDDAVLISGEMGSGKGLAAFMIHRASRRKDEPFVNVNCGVLAEGMLEVELFGHEANAFAGAGSQKKGLVETASGGTLLLQEADQLSPSLQVKLLSFLETGEFRRVGGAADLTADTRLLFSTAQDLLRLTQSGKFREDFYLKISAISLRAPSLREHKEDIPEIAEYIIKNSPHNLSARGKRLSKKAVDALLKYAWPSNVRELGNVLERAIGLAAKNVIQLKDLPISFEKRARAGRQRHLLSLSEVEKEHILHVLDAVNGNISKAARILGISRPKLYRKQEKYRSEA